MGSPQPVVFKGPRVQWYLPTTLQHLLDLCNKFPDITEKGKPQRRLVVGNTEVGVFMHDIFVFRSYLL